jgi:hypothetical protein
MSPDAPGRACSRDQGLPELPGPLPVGGRNVAGAIRWLWGIDVKRAIDMRKNAEFLVQSVEIPDPPRLDRTGAQADLARRQLSPLRRHVR